MSIPLINGVAYDFAQIRANVLGVVLYGISSINYTETQEKANNYGLGDRPVSRGSNIIETSGDLEISMNDVEALRGISPTDGSLLYIPSFDIVVIFLNAQKVVTHVLKNAEFTGDGVSGSTGDTDMRMTFNIIFSHIKYR